LSENFLLVTNKSDHTLSIVDPEKGRELAAVPVGGVTAHEVCASPDGRFAWCPIYGDSGVGMPGSDGRSVSVIDIASKKIVATIDLNEPSRPHCPLFGPRDGRLYVTSEITNSIKIIDPERRKVVDSLPTGDRESHMMVISSDGSRAYTSNVGAGTVSAIDVALKKVLAVIPVSRVAQRIAISNDDRWVFTSDQMKPEVVVIDTRTNEVSARLKMDGYGFGLTPTRDGRYLLVAQPSSKTVSVIDPDVMQVVRVIEVHPEPQEILVKPDNSVAYVSCDSSEQVAVIDLSNWRVSKLIDVGAGADGLGWAAAN
jgi:YVTN family beta-propeller protein